MSAFAISDADERVLFLNAIELSTAIFRGPDAEGWAAIFESGLPELITSIPAQLGDLTATLNNLQDSRQDLSEKADAYSNLETEYVRLFVASSGGVVAPPYESCHLSSTPRIMGDSALSMRSRLNEAGLEISLDSNEPPDHIAIELEYLYHLLATAWTDNIPAMEAKALEFIRHDMLPWVRHFHAALIKGKAHPVFLHTAHLTETVLKTLGA